MKSLMTILTLAACTWSGFAGVSSSGSSSELIVAALREPRTVAVASVLTADFVSVPIRVTTDEKNTANAYAESRQALQIIAQKTKENGQFRVSTGVAALSQYKSSYGFSSGSWQQPAAAAEIYLLVPLSKERDNIFSAGIEAARFVEGLRFPGKAKAEIGNLQLAVENPEQYRSKLLTAIAEEVKRTREAMAAQGAVKVEGLESPVSGAANGRSACRSVPALFPFVDYG